MAIRFDNVSDYLSRSANFPTVTAFTFTGWVYLTSDTNANQTVFILGTDAGKYLYLQTGGDGTSLLLGNWDGSGGHDTGSIAMSTGAWYFVAATLNGSVGKMYYAAAGDAAVTKVADSSGVSMTGNVNLFEMARDGGGSPWDGRFAYCKYWTAELSQAEIDAERFMIRPARFANLYGWYPMFPGATERARDYSSNGYNFTENGTLTDEAEPPISWGSSPFFFPYVAAVTPTFEQEGFAFGADDGNESAYTLGTQDANISSAANAAKLLRFIVNTTGDKGATAFKLKYQKNGTGGYTTVPIGATVTTTTTPSPSTGTESGNDTATSSWDISTPAASTGDLLIFCISWDDSTATTGVTAPAGKNSETLTAINSTPATDASTETRSKCWYCKTTGAWSAGTLTFTPSASEQWTASVIKIPAGEFDATTPIGASQTAAATGIAETNVQHGAFNAGASDGGGRLFVWTSADTDPQTVATGFTQVTNTDRGAVSGGLFTRNAVVTNSESFSATTVSTIASDSWTSVAFVVRANIVTTNNDVYVSTSANIAAGGEATTARLTAPSGKTTSNFTTGRRWDDENGTDTIDIVSDYYTEVEWSITLRSGLAGADYFDFRVYAADAALDTYSVTPRWTIVAVYALSATLAGTSTLTVEGENTFTPAATLAGTSALTGVGKNTFTPAATLAGTSALTVAGKNTFTPAATLAGTSDLTGVGKNTFTIAGALAGTSDLSATITIGSVNIYSLIATLAGTSILTGVGKNTFTPAAALDGSSTLTGVGKNTFTPAATLAGTSDLTATGKNTFTIVSTINGTSLLTVDITISGTNTYSLISTLVGTSILTGVGKNTFTPAAALDGTSELTVTGKNTFTPAATLDGSSVLSAIGKNTFAIVGVLDGTSLLTATILDHVIYELSAVLDGSSDMNAELINEFILAATMSGESEMRVSISMREPIGPYMRQWLKERRRVIKNI